MKAKTKQAASISLVIMLLGFIFVLFLRKNTITVLLQSGFEAGLVGGLADWFAVTALFRHPFGLPIPHTAILPNNRQRITKALISTVENDLLNKASILNKLQQFNVAQKFLHICKSNLYSEKVKTGIILITKNIISSVPITHAAAYLQNLINDYLYKLDTKKLLEVLTHECLQHNYDKQILDILLDKLQEAIKKEEIRKEMGRTAFDAVKKIETKGILQYTLNAAANMIGEDNIGDIIQSFVIRMLNELKNPNHPSRATILDSIRDSIKHISNDENIIQKFDEYKVNVTNTHEFNNYLVKTLNELQNTILNYINNDYFIEKTVLPFIENLITQISKDDELISKIEFYIQEQISDYIVHNHEKIGTLVKENIEKFDNEKLIKLIEEKVGNDLQWIRVNGAICGFAIGLILGIIKLLGFIRI